VLPRVEAEATSGPPRENVTAWGCCACRAVLPGIDAAAVELNRSGSGGDAPGHRGPTYFGCSGNHSPRMRRIFIGGQAVCGRPLALRTGLATGVPLNVKRYCVGRGASVLRSGGDAVPPCRVPS
jgi:hypothetical protein